VGPRTTIAAASDNDDDAPAPIADPRTRRSVAADMKAIFAPLPRPSKKATATESAPPAAATPVRRRGRLRSWLLALLAVAILAALLSWLLVPKPPVGRPAHQVPAPAAVMTFTRLSVPPPPASQPAPAAPATPPPAEATAPARSAALSAQRTRAPDRASAARPTRAQCGRFASEAWCLRRDIENADDRLRETYKAAMRAGVGRGTMVAVRDDWARLRHRANRDPRALIRGYAALDAQLQRAMGRR
jgi:hypothetical protein